MAQDLDGHNSKNNHDEQIDTLGHEISAQPLASRREDRLRLSLIMWPVIQSIMLCNKSPIKTVDNNPSMCQRVTCPESMGDGSEALHFGHAQTSPHVPLPLAGPDFCPL